MSFASETGYTPKTIVEIMTDLMTKINTQFGTSYTYESFVGTNFYKNFYALAQRLQENEVKTSEIFLNLQEYFEVTNERISRPVATNPGIVEKFQNEDWIASVKPMIDADAGKIYIAVDVDETDPEYLDLKLEICNIIKNSVAAGIVSQGSEVETIVLTNGQAFDFKFNLPDRIDTLLRLTLTLSENNLSVVGSPDDVKQILMANIAERYKLGMNFEPQKYFSLNDAPWTSKVLLEYDMGAGWVSTIYDADYDKLLTFDLADVTVVEV